MESACPVENPSAGFTPSAYLYKPRRPEKTLLHRLVRENLETYLACEREACPDEDPIPRHVEQTFRKYLDCGLFSAGFARAFCDNCGLDFLVATSCKTRGLCPPCNCRRMVETAAYLTDNVIPRVPVRQWVLSMPRRIRYYLLHNADLSAAVLRIFMRSVEHTIRSCSPEAPPEARFGAVVFQHRSESSLNPNPHFHAAVSDGVFADTGGAAITFFEATQLSPQDIEAVSDRVQRRTLRLLDRRGLLEPSDVRDMLKWEHNAGFSVDASVRIEAWDRLALERLLRYCTRPPFAAERLGLLDEHTILYSLSKPLPDGRSAITMTPLDLIGKLASLIPPPRAHLVHFYGVLAPNATLRKRVVETAAADSALSDRLNQAACIMGLDTKGAPPTDEPADKLPGRNARYMWAMLLARIYDCLSLLCPRCGHSMRIIAFITEPATIQKILRHIGEPFEPLTVSPARSPPQQQLDF